MAITELTGTDHVSPSLTRSLPTRGYHFNGKKVSPVRRTIGTWIAYGNHLPAITVCTHQAPCKFEYCSDQAGVNRPADDTCVALLSLQIMWVNKTVRGPRLSATCADGPRPSMTEAGGMEQGGVGHPACLPALPTAWDCLLAEDAAMLEAGGESSWPAPVVHAEQGGPPKCCLEVLREDHASSYSFQSLSLPLPVCQLLPAHWLARPEGVANGAALAMDTLILARCFSEWLKARDTACNFILGHTLAGLLLSPHPHPHRVTVILPRAITHISQYNG